MTNLTAPLAAMATILSLAAAPVLAADKEAPTTAPAVTPAAKVKPHSHLEAKGLGAVQVAAKPAAKPAKPLHDHRKEHK